MDKKSFDVLKIDEDNNKAEDNLIKLEFLTDNVKSVGDKRKKFLNRFVDRNETIAKIANLLKDIDAAIKIEFGVYEYTLVYVTMKNIIIDLMPAIYNDKINDLLLNLDDKSAIENKTLKKSIEKNEINPQLLAFLKPQDLHPERWKDLIRKNNLREEKKKNIAVTDLYQCNKCKERRCRMMEIQTRGSDEPMTRFITCLNCYHVMKR